MSMRLALAFALAAPLLGAAPAALAQTPAYRVTHTVPLGAPDRWDYVVFDGPSGRVYVSHGDRLAVVDGRDGKVLGEVDGMPGGTHGIGVSAATGKGYTDDGQAGQAAAFDLKTLQVTKRIPAKPDADGIAADPASGHIFVVNGNSKALTVIDPKDDSVVATIDLGGGLEYAVADGKGKLFVNGAENKELIRVDTRTNAVDAHWPIPGCTSPHGLALDVAGHRAFVSCLNAVMTIVNTDTGVVVATLPIGQGTDGAAFDPKRKLVFSSNYEGTVSIIREVDPNTFVPAGEIKTQMTGKNMGIDPATGRLFVIVADVDPKAPVPVGPNGRPGRATPLPGSVRLLFIDPVG